MSLSRLTISNHGITIRLDYWLTRLLKFSRKANTASLTGARKRYGGNLKKQGIIDEPLHERLNKKKDPYLLIAREFHSSRHPVSHQHVKLINFYVESNYILI